MTQPLDLSAARRSRQAPDARRQDLLQVTISCLARLGPRGATGREICRQAGVSHGLLRHYFDNPDNLLLETYQMLCGQFLERLEAQIDETDPDPWRALDAFFGRLFSDEWASADVLGAWMAFWTLVRSQDAFAQVRADFVARLHDLLSEAACRLRPAEAAMARQDAIAILTAVMDGLWLDFCLDPQPTRRDRAVALCEAAGRRLFR